MTVAFQKLRPEYLVLSILFLALCLSTKKVLSSEILNYAEEEEADVALTLYSAALLRNNLVKILGKILQHPDAMRRITWEQAAKLSWLHESLISHRLSALSLVPAAQKLLLAPAVIVPEDQISLILHETCFNYWDDSIPIHHFKIDSVLKELPESLRTEKLFHVVSKSKCTDVEPFLDIVFQKLKQGSVVLSSPLLYGILHNYPFPCILPDFQEALDYITKEIINKEQMLHDLYVSIPLGQENLKAFLLNVVEFLFSDQSPLSHTAKLQIQIILPYLKTDICKYLYSNTLSSSKNYIDLFSALKNDDYPADVNDAKHTLMSALKSRELDLQKYAVGFNPELYGSNRLSLLLAYLQRLSILLPNVHPASAYISTLLPYAKFKYTASKGGTFIPRTPFDIAMLFNAFNTIGEDLSEARTELYQALIKEIQWESILNNFPYYKYSDPRSLLVSMLYRILSHKEGLKLCHKIVLKHFLDKVKNFTKQCSNVKLNKVHGFTTISKPVDILLNYSLATITLPSEKSKYATYGPNYTTYVTHTENKFTTYPLIITEVPVIKQNEAQHLLKTKCTINGTVDRRIKSAMNDILQYLEVEKYGIFPSYIHIECNDSNQKKLYLSSKEYPVCTGVTPLPTVDIQQMHTTGNKILFKTETAKNYSTEIEVIPTEAATFGVTSTDLVGEQLTTSKPITEMNKITEIFQENVDTTTIAATLPVSETESMYETSTIAAMTKEDTMEVTRTTIHPVYTQTIKGKEIDIHKITTESAEMELTNDSFILPTEGQTSTSRRGAEYTTFIAPIVEMTDKNKLKHMEMSSTVLPEVYVKQTTTDITEISSMLPETMDEKTTINLELTETLPMKIILDVEQTTVIPTESKYTTDTIPSVTDMMTTEKPETVTIKNEVTESETIFLTNEEVGTVDMFNSEVTMDSELPDTTLFKVQASKTYASQTATFTMPTITEMNTNEFVTHYTSHDTTTETELKPTETIEKYSEELTTQETYAVENERQTTRSPISYTETETTPTPFKEKYVSEASEVYTWKKETEETVTITEETPTYAMPNIYNDAFTTEIPLPALVKRINKTSNGIECIKIPNITSLLAPQVVSKEPIILIRNILFKPEVLVALKQFKLAESESPSEMLIRFLKFLKYYVPLTPVIINTIDEILLKISLDFSFINAPYRMIEICMDDKGEVQSISPDATTLSASEALPLTTDNGVYTTTDKEALEAETIETQTEQMSTTVTPTTQITTLAEVFLSTLSETMNKTSRTAECMKIPNITTLLTAIPQVNKESFHTVESILLKPEVLVAIKKFKVIQTEAPAEMLIRLLNFIKYYTELNSMIMNAIDDVLSEININSYEMNITFSTLEVCIDEAGMIQTILPVISSLETTEEMSSTVSYYDAHTKKGIWRIETQESIISTEKIPASIAPATNSEFISTTLEQTSLPIISEGKIAINKTSNIIKCINVPNIISLLALQQNVSRESIILIRNILFKPEVLVALKQFKLAESESPSEMLIRFLKFLKYYVPLTPVIINTIDEILLKISLDSSFINVPFRMIEICMDDKGEVQSISPDATTLSASEALPLTTDNGVYTTTDKEALEAETIETQTEQMSTTVTPTTQITTLAEVFLSTLSETMNKTSRTAECMKIPNITTLLTAIPQVNKESFHTVESILLKPEVLVAIKKFKVIQTEAPAEMLIRLLNFIKYYTELNSMIMNAIDDVLSEININSYEMNITFSTLEVCIDEAGMIQTILPVISSLETTEEMSSTVSYYDAHTKKGIWRIETQESIISTEKIPASIAPATNSEFISTTLEQTSLPIISEGKIAINKTSNIIKCINVPNIISLLALQQNVSRESIILIRNILFKPEVLVALKQFKLAESESPSEMLIRFLKFLKYYVPLTPVIINTIDEILLKISLDSSFINVPFRMIEICMDDKGEVQSISPDATTLSASEALPLTTDNGVYTTTDKEALEAETIETQTEQMSTTVTPTTQITTLAEVFLSTLSETMNKTSSTVECMKIPNITTLLTAIPQVNKESFHTVESILLKPEVLVAIKKFKFIQTEAPAEMLIRLLNFIKYYLELNSKIMNAIDDVLSEININSYAMNITLSTLEVCTDEAGIVQTILPVISSLEPTEEIPSTISYHEADELHDKEDILKTTSPAVIVESKVHFTTQKYTETTVPLASDTYINSTETALSIPSLEETETTTEITDSAKTTTIISQPSPGIDENDILGVGAELVIKQHKVSSSIQDTNIEPVQKAQTFTNKPLYTETEIITTTSSLEEQSTTSTEIGTTVPMLGYAVTQTAESDTAVITMKTEESIQETKSVQQEETTIITTEKAETHTETAVAETKLTEIINETTDEMATMEISTIGAFSTNISKMTTETTEAVQGTAITEIEPIEKSEEVTDTTWITKIPTDQENLTTMHMFVKEMLQTITETTAMWSTKKPVTEEDFTHMPTDFTQTPEAIPITALGSKQILEVIDHEWTTETATTTTTTNSLGKTETPELITEIDTVPTEVQLTKITTEIPLITEATTLLGTADRAEGTDQFSSTVNADIAPYETMKHWPFSITSTTETVTKEMPQLTQSNKIHLSTTSSSTNTAITQETTTDNDEYVIMYTMATDKIETKAEPTISSLQSTQKLNETKSNLHCIRIPKISLLLNATEHLSHDLLNALRKILHRTDVLSVLKNFQIPETSTVAYALRKLLIFLKYNADLDIPTTESISKIMRNIKYGALGASGIIMNEICFNASTLVQPTTSSLAHLKEQTPAAEGQKITEAEASSEIINTSYVSAVSDSGEQTTPPIISTFMPLDFSNIAKQIDHFPTSMPSFSKLKESTISTTMISADIKDLKTTVLPISTQSEAKSIVPLTTQLQKEEDISETPVQFTSAEALTNTLVMQSSEKEFILTPAVLYEAPKNLNLPMSTAPTAPPTEQTTETTDSPALTSKQSTPSVSQAARVAYTEIPPNEDFYIPTLPNLTNIIHSKERKAYTIYPNMIEDQLLAPWYYKENIIVPQDCLHENMTQMLVIDVISLFEVLDSQISNTSLKHIIEAVSAPEIEKELKILDWNHYNNKQTFLRDVVTFLILNSTHTDDIKEELINILHHIKINSADQLPTFKFICIPTTLFPINKSNEYGVETIIRIPTKEQCSTNNSNVVISMHVSPLLKCIDYQAPKLAKATILALLNRDGISSLLTHFNVLKYKTNGELLYALLTHLSYTPSLEDNVLRSIRILLSFIKFDGPAELAPNLTTECVNSDEIESMRYTSMFQVTTPESFTLEKNSKHILGLQVQQCTENTTHLFVIDMPSLFQAVKPEVSPILQKNIMNILDKPETQIKLKALPWDRYVTKAEFLNDVLSYISSKSTQNELSNAMKKVASNIRYNGPGTKHPMFKFICMDSDKIYFTKKEETISSNLMLPTIGDCNNESVAVLVINIDSMMKTIKPEAPPLSKATAVAFFQRPDFYTTISDLKLENLTSPGMALRKILTHLITKGKLETPVLRCVKDLLNYITLDGPGAQTLNMRMECQPACTTALAVDEKSDEDAKMIIPFQCSDNLTLSGTFTADITSLFSTINTSAVPHLVNRIIDYFKTFKIRQLLTEYKWDIYETRGQLLKNLLFLVQSTVSDEDDINVAIQEVLPLVNTDVDGSIPPVLKFECDANAGNTTVERNTTCDNDSVPLWVVNITSLFKALSNDTPAMAVQILSSYLTMLDFYKNLLGFNIHGYNTKGQFLWKMLTFIMVQDSLSLTLRNAAAALVTYVQLDGPGSEQIEGTILCNITMEATYFEFSSENIKKEPENSIIKIISECHENGTMDIVDVDVTSVVKILPKGLQKKMHNLSTFLKSSKIKNKLKAFKWDVYHETKSELLKHILTLLFKTMPLEENILIQVDKHIQKISNIIETVVPLLSYRCINLREKYSNLEINKTKETQIHEIVGGPAIMQPMEGKCPTENNNTATPTIVVNIANLFTALKPNTPALAKAIITAYVTKPDFYKKITEFNFEEYKTRGEQLQQLLAFLVTTTSDPALMKATDKLLMNILLDGPGQLPSVFRVVCSTTLNQLIGFTRRTNVTLETTDILGTEAEGLSSTFPILNPCIEGSFGMTYKINIPSMFNALKSEFPKTSLAKLATFIAKPSFYTKFKDFDVVSHKTQGSLLNAMLSFISKKQDTPSQIVQAIDDILPFVHSVALGKKTPKINLNCSLPNSQDIMNAEKASNIYISKEQGVNIVSHEGIHCNHIEHHTQIIKGRTIYLLDVLTLVNILAISDYEKDLIIMLLQSPVFHNQLQLSNFKILSTRANTLEYLLLLLNKNESLQQNETEIVQKALSEIRHSGEANLPPVLTIKCSTDMKLMQRYLAETTNETCFLPHQYNSTGIAYDLQWASLLEALSPQTPAKLLEKLQIFLNMINKKNYLGGFDVFQYRTRAALLKDVLVFLALKPSLNLENKELISSLLPYVLLQGKGALAPVVVSDCPEINDYYITETDFTTEGLYMTTSLDPCLLDPNSIYITQFDVPTLFTTLDYEAPPHSVNVINNYLQDDDLHEKLYGFDIKKYETKNDLLQGLLAFIWSDQNSQESEKAAAKILLPHIMFNGTGEPPVLQNVCYVPKKGYIRHVDDIPKSLMLVYPTAKICLHNMTHVPGIVVYRITLSTLFKALHPKLQSQEYLPVSKFLSKPYAYKYIQGINIERYHTRGELLRAVLTFLRFSQKYMEPAVKDTLIKVLPFIYLDGLGNLPVEKYSECSPVLEEDKSSALQLQEVLQAINQTNLNAESYDALLTIFDFLTSPSFNLTEYVPWLDNKRAITNGELLKIILLQVSDKNPNMGKFAALLIPQIEEIHGNGGKRAKIETYRYKEMITPYEINFLELLKALKPAAPKNAVSYVFNLFGRQDIYKDLKDFDPDKYETQGALLVGILKFLEIKYTADSAAAKYIKELIPFVDMNDSGVLPPIMKTVYITLNTSVSVFRLDLGVLYKLIPRENLTDEQQQAMDEIFKFLSTKGYKIPELFQGLSSRIAPQVQIKLIFIKLKLVADEHLKAYANTMLHVLEENLPQYSSHNELIPEMDWIEVLHAIPDSEVPTEVITSKKELYRFFLSASFNIIIKDYRVNLSVSRGKFLKDLLAYLRNKPEVSSVKVLKQAIAYVLMFIKEIGAGAMSVQDDIILPEQQEEARSAQNRIKELLYQVLGVIEQDGAFEILQTLQKLFDSTTKLNLVTTYLGYDVLEEFPPKERLIIILRRIYHNFIMFLDQNSISAIDMVFISLGETKQQTSEILHFLPIDMQTLLNTVLGPDTPPLVAAASEFIKSNINLNTVPLGKAFQDTVPSILNLNVRKRLTVILRILWRVFSKYDDTKIHQSIKTVYEFLLPNKPGTELRTQEHHMAIIAALTGLIRPNSPSKIQNVKNIVMKHLASQQNVYDKVLAHLVTRNLPPKDLIAKALRRFREHQLKMNPKLWSAVSVIFDYLHIPEHDSSEEIVEDRINIVDEFKYLVDEAGIGIAPAKRILIKYIIDKKSKLQKLFRAQHILLQYPPAEKMAIILNRLLTIYKDTLPPEIFSAAKTILSHLNVLTNEVDVSNISIDKLFSSVINKLAPKNVIKAKKVIQNLLLNKSNVQQQVLQNIIIQKYFTPERQLVTILRQFHNMFNQQLHKATLESLITLFDYLQVSLNSSVEDQFIGNFTFKPVFENIFPEHEVPEYVTKAVNIILQLLHSENIDIKHVLYGIHLWKLPPDSQVSIILYRLTKVPYINKETRDAIDILLAGLDIDLDELASEDIDESYTPAKLFNEALGNTSTPPEVQEAKGIIMKFLLSGSSKVKNVYRGIDFSNIPQPKNRLVSILKNIHNKRNIVGVKMTEALHVMSDFLQVDLGKQKIDPYTFDFDGIFDRVVPNAPYSIRQAKKLFLKAIKNRPGTFKKILDHINITEYENENETVCKILNATLHYTRPLSKQLQSATNLILDYLQRVPISAETNASLDYSSKDVKVEEDTVGFRMFDDEFKPKGKWKRKKKLRRYD